MSICRAGTVRTSSASERPAKEQVGADGGAKDGYHGREVISIPTHRGNDEAFFGFRPRYLHHEHAGHIGEQKQRQPLQHRNVAGVLQENLERDTDRRKQQNIKKMRAAKLEASAMAPRFAPMLMALAISSNDTIDVSSQEGQC